MNRPNHPASKEIGNAQGVFAKDKAANLLRWYDENARELPWRVPPELSKNGHLPDPYHVWLSEIMLQQTQVKTVIAYFLKFLKLWPSLTDMAQADTEDILKAWAGLGYYSRARNLKKCADLLYAEYDGNFPSDAGELTKLPGIGAYTSAAISAIAFGKPAVVVDGNIERIMARFHLISTPIPKAKPEIAAHVNAILPEVRAGDFAQAMMDLGATICTPKSPDCNCCPWEIGCKAKERGEQLNFPVKLPKKPKPKRRGAAFVAISDDGYVLLRKRPDQGLFAGMSEVPTTDWSIKKDGETGVDAAPFSAEWTKAGAVSHVFTHFQLGLDVYCCRPLRNVTNQGWWVQQNLVMEEALPSLMKKVIVCAFDNLDEGE